MRIVQQMQDPVRLSIAEADDGDEIFLSYKSSPGNYGRGIERDGIGPPRFWWNDRPHYIYDAHAQRRGSWFILKSDKLPDDIETRRRMRSPGIDPALLELAVRRFLVIGRDIYWVAGILLVYFDSR